MDSQEFRNVVGLEPERRYEYFVKKVADWREVWSLWKDGWALMGDAEGKELVPVWPHALFAEVCAHGEWLSYAPKKVDLDDWLNKWTLGMERDARNVAVFPVEKGQATTTTPAQLKSDLEKELLKYTERRGPGASPAS